MSEAGQGISSEGLLVRNPWNIIWKAAIHYVNEYNKYIGTYTSNICL